MNNSLEALKRIETIFPYNREHKPNYYTQFSSSYEPFYKDFDCIKQDLDSLETKCKVNQELNEVYKVKIKKLEKELRQTKLNFKNSQIHSKNCYKKLKAKYQKLEKEHEKLKEKYKHRAETSNDLCEAVKHYEKAFEILCVKNIHKRTLKTSKNVEDYNSQIEKYSYYDELEQEEYELLKEVLGNA